MNRHFFSKQVPAIILSCLVFFSGMVFATEVTNTADSGSGSLRDEIAATPVGGTVTFADSLSGMTISIASGELLVDKELTIDASNLTSPVIIDAGGNSRVFRVQGDPVLFKSLVIRNGSTADQGGGIFNNGGNLTLENVTVIANQVTGAAPEGRGGGIYNGGSATLTIERSTVSTNLASGTGGQGGGIYNNGGSLSINQSTLRSNQADDDGGGLYNDDNDDGAGVIITDSTFASNMASSDDGGGIFNTDSGGISLTQCTLVGNQSGDKGGAAFSAGTISLTRSTVAFNIALGNTAGGIRLNSSARLNLENSIVATNTSAGSEPDISKNSGTVAPAGTNLIGDRDSVEAEFDFDLPLVGEAGNLATPLLGPPAEYGGLTTTLHPMPHSPAIDAAGSTDPGGTDQRGLPRFVGGQLDIGAVETGNLAVDTLVDESFGTILGLGLSLREAIVVIPDCATIVFDPALDSQTITLSQGELITNRSFTIDASSLPGGLTIDGNSASRILDVDSPGTVVIDSLTLSGGNGQGATESGSGGAIRNAGHLTLNNSTVSDNGADVDGGGIYNSGTLVIESSSLYNNQVPDVPAPNRGGALFVHDSGDATLRNSTFYQNTADSGGGVFNAGTVTLENTTLAQNTSRETGGGIHNINDLTLKNATVSSNGAQYGGGVYNGSPPGETATLNLENTIVAGNTAPQQGPDIDNTLSPGTVTPTGKNLIGDIAESSLSAGANVIIDPAQLAPLGNYGGNVFTMHPNGGSPAVDPTGTVARSLPTDARGSDALFGTSVDIGAVEARDIVVNTTADENNGLDAEGSGNSLRDAIDAAGEGGTITFDPSLSGKTLTLGGTEILINKNLSIDASNLPRGLTIDADGNSRIFNVDPSANIVVLTSLTLRGGYHTMQGGAISNRGNLTLLGVTLVENSAQIGGAVYNGNYLDCQNCTFTRNSATDHGGAIYNFVRAWLSGSTVAGNHANTSGGGIYNQFADLNLDNSIIANNAAPTGPDIHNETGNLASVNLTDVNLVGDNSDSDLAPVPGLIGTSANPVDPLLSPLAWFGGPVQTMHPLAGSPAIDPNGVFTAARPTDARGYSRPANNTTPDLGAVEAGPVILVSSNADSGAGSLRRAVSDTTTPGTVIRFDPATFPNTINLGLGISLAADQSIFMDASDVGGCGVTLDAGRNNRIFRVDETTSTLALHSLTLTNGFVPTNFNGGAIVNRGTVSVISSTLHNNTATEDGGAMFNAGSQAIAAIINSTFHGNLANGAGGGAFANQDDASASFYHATISGNSAPNGTAGGIAYASGQVTIENSIVAGNTASGADNISAEVTVTGTNVTSGDPFLTPLARFGGPVPTMHPLVGSPAIDPSGGDTFSPLTTDSRGYSRLIDDDFTPGAIADLGAVEVGPTIFVFSGDDSGPGSLRQAIADGTTPGQVIRLSENVTLSSELDIPANQSLFIEGFNSPTLDASGSNDRIFHITDPSATLAFSHLEITGGNSSGSGGAIRNQGTLSVLNSTLTGNASGGNGGALRNEHKLTVINSTFFDNTATTSGGALQNTIAGAHATVLNSTFTNNTASTNDGGAINVGGDTSATLRNVTITGNSAPADSGGGIRSASTATTSLENSIVAGNTANTDDNLQGTITQLGDNLTSGDPLLAPLADYGGPTNTMPPLPGSDAIDAATTGLLSDQRGLGRAVGAGFDIGAVEFLGAVVTTLADDTITPPTGSLREAINTPFVSHITFDANLPSNFVYLASELPLLRSVTIDASALPGGMILEANGSDRVMGVAAGKIVTLDSLVLRGGNTSTGAGIINFGNLTLNNATLLDNTSDFGGGIYNTNGATLTLNNSTLSGCIAADRGGAIFNHQFGTVILNNTTLSDNSANSQGGGIRNIGNITLNNTTLSGNSSPLGGGIYNGSNGTLTLNNATLSGNSAATGAGGILNNGTLNLNNTIVANNSSPSGPDIGNSGTINPPTGVNLLSDLSGSGLSLGPNLIVDSDPKLSPLANYGGPTETMAPMPGSPAIDATATGPATDQRGLARSVGGDFDIGAVEFLSAVVATNADDATVPLGGSLRDAIATPFVSYITFDPTLSGETIALDGDQLTLDRSLTLSASALPNGLVLDAGGNDRVMEISSGNIVALDSLTLTGGNTHFTLGGGAILNAGTLTLTNTTLFGNSATGGVGGGAILNAGTLTVTNTTLFGNSTDYTGGGIASYSGTLTVTNTTLFGNSAGVAGGGIYNIDNIGPLTLTNTIVAANTAPDGPDIEHSSGTINPPTGVNLLSNISGSGLSAGPNIIVASDPKLSPLANYGGPTATMPPMPDSPAIDATSTGLATDQRGLARAVDGDASPGTSEFDIGAAEFLPLVVTTTADNATNPIAGSIRQAIATPFVSHITFDPTLSGQSVILDEAELAIDRSLTIDASPLSRGVTLDAAGHSRVMAVNPGNTVNLNSLTITGGNSPSNSGGGILNNATLTLNNTTVSGNSSSVSGGGISSGGTLTLNNATVAGNTAEPGAGGIFNGGTVNLNNATVCYNSGGGIFSLGTINLNNSIVARNIFPPAYVADITGTINPTGANLLSSGFGFPANILVDPNPKLSPLAWFGGPVQTVHPLAGSPAIDPSGSTARTLATDARGYSGTVGSVDIGAVETGPVITVDNTGDDVATATTLRKAMADATDPGTVIRFDKNVFNGEPADTIIPQSQIEVGTGESLFLDASNITGGVTLDASGQSNRHFLISDPTGTLAFTDLTLKGGSVSAANAGGSIANLGTLSILHSTLEDNESTSDSAGALYTDPTGLTSIQDSIFSQNSASTFGGAIRNLGDLEIQRSTFFDNTALTGGAIHNDFGQAVARVINSTLSGNTASGNGGAFNNSNGAQALLQHVTISGNQASTGAGGGIRRQGGTLTIENSIVAGNTAQTSSTDNLAGDITETGSNLTTGDPLLAPLEDFGGSTTVMLPLPGSPVVEGGTLLANSPHTDQLGKFRRSGMLPDLGAVESEPLSELSLQSNDGDSIPDILEGPGGAYPHLNPNANDSSVDLDGDGSTDEQEIANMTNLYDPGSYFRIVSFDIISVDSMTGEVTAEVTFSSYPGLSYTLECQEDLDFASGQEISVGAASGLTTTETITLMPGRDFVRARRD